MYHIKDNIVQDMYYVMIADNWRNKFFYDIISKISKDKVVLDMGTGTGILSFYALASEAKFVYAIEKDFRMSLFAKDLLKKKFPLNKFKVINDNFYNNKIDAIIKDKIDILVSETVGPGLFDHGMINTWYKISRFASDNFISIPDCLSIDLWFYNHEDVAEYFDFSITKNDVIDQNFFDAFCLTDQKFSKIKNYDFPKWANLKKMQEPLDIWKNFFNYSFNSLPNLDENNVPIISKKIVINRPCTLVLVNKISFLDKILFLHEATKGMPWVQSPLIVVNEPGEYTLTYDYSITYSDNKWVLKKV